MTHIRFTREYRKTLKRIVSHYTICDKMKKCKHLDWIILILCIIGFIIEFLCVSMADIAIYILGVIGVLYCIYHIFVFCCRPIKRDWILAKGNFLIKVVNFVLLIPFVVTLFITLPGSLRDDKSFSPKNLVFEEKLYNDKTVSDTEISQQVSPSIFWTVYYHFIDPGNQHMTTSESGRRDAALIAILGYILLNGLLISTLISWFDRRRYQW